jgi:hypothetical protein
VEKDVEFLFYFILLAHGSWKLTKKKKERKKEKATGTETVTARKLPGSSTLAAPTTRPQVGSEE